MTDVSFSPLSAAKYSFSITSSPPSLPITSALACASGRGLLRIARASYGPAGAALARGTLSTVCNDGTWRIRDTARRGGRGAGESSTHTDFMHACTGTTDGRTGGESYHGCEGRFGVPQRALRGRDGVVLQPQPRERERGRGPPRRMPPEAEESEPC